MKTLSIYTIVIFLIGCTFAQSRWTKTTKLTSWEDIPDLKFIDYNIYFSPEFNMDYSVKRVPQIQLDLTYQNMSKQSIKSVTFEIIIFCKSVETGEELQQIKVKPLTEAREVPPLAKASFLYEPSVKGVSFPVKQIVRISQIKYADGSVWEYTNK